MNQHDVVRKWVAGVKPKGKTSSLMFIGDTIYSWGHHWPVAKRVKLQDTNRTVYLVHNVSHTAATNGHTSAVNQGLYRNHCERYSVEHDFFDMVHDEATLMEAIEASKVSAATRAEEKRVRTNERAKRNREDLAERARRGVERELGLESIDCVSDSLVVKIARLCGLDMGSRYYRYNRWAHQPKYDAFTKFLNAAVQANPDMLKDPKAINAVITGYNQLLA